MIIDSGSDLLQIESTEILLPSDRDLAPFFNIAESGGIIPPIPIKIEITAPPGSQRLGGYSMKNFLTLESQKWLI